MRSSHKGITCWGGVSRCSGHQPPLSTTWNWLGGLPAFDFGAPFFVPIGGIDAQTATLDVSGSKMTGGGGWGGGGRDRAW